MKHYMQTIERFTSLLECRTQFQQKKWLVPLFHWPPSIVISLASNGINLGWLFTKFPAWSHLGIFFLKQKPMLSVLGEAVLVGHYLALFLEVLWNMGFTWVPQQWKLKMWKGLWCPSKVNWKGQCNWQTKCLMKESVYTWSMPGQQHHKLSGNGRMCGKGR